MIVTSETMYYFLGSGFMKRKTEKQFVYLSHNLRTIRLANRMSIRQMAQVLELRPQEVWLLEHRFCPDVTIDFLLDFDRHFDVQPWELFEKRLLGRKDAGVPGSCAEDGSA